MTINYRGLPEITFTMFLFKVLTFFLILGHCDAFADDYYIIKSKETLSEILEDNDMEPIYGENGNLNKLLRLNPELQKTKSKELIPGTRIILPASWKSKFETLAKLPAKEILKTELKDADNSVANKPQRINYEYRFESQSNFQNELPKYSFEDSQKNLGTNNFNESQILSNELNHELFKDNEFSIVKSQLGPVAINIIRKILITQYPPAIVEKEKQVEIIPAVVVSEPILKEAVVTNFKVDKKEEIKSEAVDISEYQKFNYGYNFVSQPNFLEILPKYVLGQSQQNLGTMHFKENFIDEKRWDSNVLTGNDLSESDLHINPVSAKLIRNLLLAKYQSMESRRIPANEPMPNNNIEITFPNDTQIAIAPVVVAAAPIVAAPVLTAPIVAVPIPATIQPVKIIPALTSKGFQPKEPEKNEDVSYDQHFTYAITPKVSWKNINSIDDNPKTKSTINALTNMNYGAHLEYGMQMSEDLKVFTFFENMKMSFLPDSKINLVKQDFNSQELGSGFLYKNFIFSFSMGDEFFLTSPTLNTVDVKKIKLPKVSFGTNLPLYKFREARIEATFIGEMTAPRRDPSISTKFGVGGRFEVKSTLKNRSFKIGYELLQISASAHSTKNEDIYWMFTWDI